MMIIFVLLASLIASVRCAGSLECTSGVATSSKVFKAYDLDDDGVITRPEGIEVFKRSDVNSDGVITPNEFSTEWYFYRNAILMPFFAFGDDDDDNDIDLNEGLRAFDYFDNNGDGVITYHEFTGTWGYLSKTLYSEKK
ncbi:hypothetical protein ACF0H5_020645 [Mactra antiquata]